MKSDFFAGRKVLVMGLGRFGGGIDSAVFACTAGAEVKVTDLASAGRLKESLEQLRDFPGIRYRLGGHEFADFEWADVVIANPAVGGDNEYLQYARRLNKLVTSQVGIFFELCAATIIGITGSNGKSTTTALAAHLLRAASRQKGWRYGKVWLGGNIGNEPLLTVVEQMNRDDLVVLELSSFQIEQLGQEQKAPHIGLLTNLVPNHLDRYGTFERYCRAKEMMFRLQRPAGGRKAVSIFNVEDESGAAWYEKYRNDAGRVCIGFSADDVGEDIRERFGLVGRANLSNLAAAMAVANRFGVDREVVRQCVGDFKGLAHRLELVAEIGGVRWYNDSKATTPEAATAAVEAFAEPVIIIAGGYDKQIALDSFGAAIAKKAKAAILIGETAGKIRDAIAGSGANGVVTELAGSLAEAVERAGKLASAGDVVVLSPACASYDMFDNYQQRGRMFAELVQSLASGKHPAASPGTNR